MSSIFVVLRATVFCAVGDPAGNLLRVREEAEIFYPSEREEFQ